MFRTDEAGAAGHEDQGRGSPVNPSSASMAPHSIWPRVMCISWMRAVTSLGTARRGSASRGRSSTVAAAESRRDESLAQRLLEASEHIGAPARGGERDRDIARASQRLDLAGEDLLETQIVTCCGEDGTVRGECQTGYGGPVADVAHGELCREMLGIRRAAAVAEEQDPAACVQARDTCVDQPGEGLCECLAGVPNHHLVLVELRLEVVPKVHATTVRNAPGIAVADGQFKEFEETAGGWLPRGGWR